MTNGEKQKNKENQIPSEDTTEWNNNILYDMTNY